jgi:alanine-synthesizing transaminase
MFSHRTGWNLTRNRYTEALLQHRRSGKELLDLTASNPTAVGISYQQAGISKALSEGTVLTYYPIAKGLLSARETIASYYVEKGSAVNPEALVLTTSTSEAYSFVFRLLCDAGDSVLVPAPSYPLFDFLADLNDVRLEAYELVYDQGWQVDFTSLQSALDRARSKGGRCRAVMLVHPNNPTGSFIKPHERDELNRLCLAYEMAIIADEVFLDYRLTDSVTLTFSGNDEALTFTLSGLSKISALPQMKIAWIAVSGPGGLKSEAVARLEVIADTYLSMNAPLQLALPAMLAERHRVQPQLLLRVHQNLLMLDTHLLAHKSCERLALEGGWYAVLRVPVLGSDEDLAVALVENTGVLLQPGHFYNFPSVGYLVASLITPTQEFDTGMARALEFISGR